MKKCLLLLVALLMNLATFARDFDYEYEGHTLTYTVIDEEARTVETKAGYHESVPAWWNYTYAAGNWVSGDLIIPSIVMDDDTEYTVIKIADCAFLECWYLTSVTIGDSVTVIGEDAFHGCMDLTSVTIGESVTRILSGAFSSCSGLTKAEFASIEVLCSIGFDDASSNPLSYANLYIKGEEVKELVIPESVTKIGYYAFFNCTGLTSVTIGDSVTEIGWCAFWGCTGLTSVIIGESVTDIGDVAFWGCTGLASVIIPDSVTEIGNGAFCSCTGLTSVTIGAYVTEIRNGVFWDCTGLTSVYCSAKKPMSGDDQAFSNQTYNEATLYVPEEAIKKYKKLIPWKHFRTIQPYNFTNSIKELDMESISEESCKIFNLNGVEVRDNISGLAPGIYIIRQGGTTRKIMVK